MIFLLLSSMDLTLFSFEADESQVIIEAQVGHIRAVSENGVNASTPRCPQDLQQLPHMSSTIYVF